MNRIVLIGNGFDLAHGLLTSYKDFIDDYWNDVFNEIYGEYEQWQHQTYGTPPRLEPYEDSFVNFQIIARKVIKAKEVLPSYESQDPYSDLCRFIEEYNNSNYGTTISLKFKNQFFEHISNLRSLKNWVDIENEYYRLLTQQCVSIRSIYDDAKQLNADFRKLEIKLIAYLTKIQNEHISDDLKNNEIENLLFEPFNLQDISNSGLGLLLDNIGFEVAELPGGMSGEEIEEEMKNHPEYSFMRTEKEAYREMIKTKLLNGKLKEFTFPNRALFLNFNYTNTAERLHAESTNRSCELIYIHGKLNDPDSSIIFGYGDEMDEHYIKIVNLNDNDYLQNIKSIRYLETDNYRKLLSFMDDAPYQIYIMGHSCGNSDRTLLNTLFEHKNCMSIKPFYYIDEDGKDNFIDIVQNISRNFKDATLMRDRVVNKGYCEPLPQNETE
jgi:hypothetical protein